MPPPEKTQARKPGRDGRRTRLAIEREALRLFAERGVDATSVKDIARAVGVAEAALYRHFPSKEEMARAIFARHYGDLAARVQAIAAEPWPFARQAQALVALFCALFDEMPDVFAFVLFNQHAHLRYVPDDPQSNAASALRDLMSAAHARGEIAQGNADLAAAMALGTVVQPAVFKLYGRLPGSLSTYREALTLAALSAVGATIPD